MFDFRRAGPADSAMLLAWRNDPLTRVNSRNTSAVPVRDHEEWLRHHDPLIVMENGTPVGTVRCENGEMSWTVSPSHRGMGIGKRMVLQFSTGKELTAEIKPDNIASQKIAEFAGYRLIGLLYRNYD